MSQATLTIADGSGSTVLTEINSALLNLASLCAGSTDPSSNTGGVVAYSFWLDTSSTTNILKQRNAANTGWNTIFTINQTNGAVSWTSSNLAPIASPTFTGTQTLPLMVTQTILENETITSASANGTINFDALTQSIVYFTLSASTNFTLNIRGNSTTTLNSLMTTGQSLSIAFKCTNGTTPYYLSGFQIDGATVTPKWQGGASPTSGNASGIDVYAITITKTGGGTYTALISQTKFA